MDTDRFIVYIKAEYIFIDIAKDFETRFYTLNDELDSPSPEGKKFKSTIVHELSGQNKRFWLRWGEKISLGLLISIMSLVYGTGHYLG